jgi:hypothetical protein
MIGSLLQVVASAAAARSLRVAAREAAMRALLTVGAGIAIAVGAVGLSYSVFLVLERHLDPAGASAIVSGFWGLLGLAYFVTTRGGRRRP